MILTLLLIVITLEGAELQKLDGWDLNVAFYSHLFKKLGQEEES